MFGVIHLRPGTFFHTPKIVYQGSAILDSSQSNNVSWESMKEILQTKFYLEEQASESILVKSASWMLGAS
jgi:hypothetical protein